MVKYPLLLIAVLFSNVVAALSVQADKQQYGAKEAITLHIQADGKHAQEALDLTPINADFQRFSVDFAHTQTATGWHSVWTLVLRAKQVGEVTIPALSVGTAQTQAFNLDVSSAFDLDQTRDVILKTTVDKSTAYVEEQVIFTQWLYQRGHVTEGLLSEPRVPHAIVKRLGNDTTRHEKIGGISYQLIKRRYAIFPQRAGSLVIPKTHFSGRLAHRNDVLSQSILRAKTKLTMQAAAIKITILPIAEGFTVDNWVIASELSVSSEWDDATDTFTLGVPRVQTLTVRAHGLLATQLPKLSAPLLLAFKTYLESGQSEVHEDAHGLVSEKHYRMTYIPLRQGVQSIPEVRIPWWNSHTQQAQIARIEAITRTVLPGNIVHQKTPVPSRPVLPPVLPVKPVKPQATYRTWSDISDYLPSLDTVLIALGILWAVLKTRTWMSPEHKRYRMHEVKEKVVTRFMYNIKKGCQTEDNHYVYHQMLAWANSQWPTQHFANLTHIARYLKDPELNRKIEKLNRSRFQKIQPGWHGASFWRVLKMVMKQKKPPAPKNPPVHLPTLYRQ